jgi:hypothetical protein
VKIIDFEKHGDVVRFYLGADDCKDYWGDDWDDAPYEHNAGPVYDEYVKDYVDYIFPFDSFVLEPCDGAYNSEFSKEDMKKRTIPCIVCVPKWLADGSWNDMFEYWKSAAGTMRFYFEDKLNVPDDHFVKLT